MDPGHRELIVGLAMVMAAGLAISMTPGKHVARDGIVVDLENMVPREFGEWKQLHGLIPVLAVDPREGGAMSDIYDQVVMRTYENSRGNQVMFAVAYVENQNDRGEIHKPEVCYAAQGFHLQERGTTTVDVSGLKLPVVHLVAFNGQRVEPITYWMTVGDYVVTDGFSRKLAQLRYGLGGAVTDGMLIRISSVTRDEKSAYDLHRSFIQELFRSISEDKRLRFAGRNSNVNG